jgi:hypothetical protein
MCFLWGLNRETVTTHALHFIISSQERFSTNTKYFVVTTDGSRCNYVKSKNVNSFLMIKIDIGQHKNLSTCDKIHSTVVVVIKCDSENRIS